MIRPAITDVTVVSAANHPVSVWGTGEAVILDPLASRYYSLEGVGERVWQLLQTPTRIIDLRDALIDEYDVAADTLLDDIKDLIGELAAAGLVEIDDEAGP